MVSTSVHEHCGIRFDGYAPPGCPDPGSHRQRPAGGPSHVAVSVPTVRPADPLAKELSDGLHRIARNYEREGSGPGSRFEGRLLEDVQAEWVLRELLTAETGPMSTMPVPLLPAGMRVRSASDGGVALECEGHGRVVPDFGTISLRTLSFEARRHWREHHG